MEAYNTATSYPKLVTEIARQKAYGNAPPRKRAALFQVATQDEWQEIILSARLW